MTRFILLVLGALLALISAVHGTDELIRLYSFSSDQCYGPPQGGNIDIKRGECHNLPSGARSVKPFLHKNRKFVDEINNGATICEFIVYKQPGCLENQELQIESLPGVIQQCVFPASSTAMFSVKYDCGPTHASITSTNTTYTTVLMATSWSIDDSDSPISSVATETLTIVHVDNRQFAGQSLEPSPKRLEPRANGHLGVWMFHPWSLSIICYDCWETDGIKIECRQGPNNPIDCGDRPAAIDGAPLTVTTTDSSTTVTMTTVNLATLTTTTVNPSQVSPMGTIPPPLEKRRSWHRRVTFNNPFAPGIRLCADAEWEKRGQAKAEIRLQKVGENMKKCDEAKELQNLDLPSPVTLVSSVTTTITGIVLETVSTHEILELSSDAATTTALAHKDL